MSKTPFSQVAKYDLTTPTTPIHFSARESSVPKTFSSRNNLIAQTEDFENRRFLSADKTSLDLSKTLIVHSILRGYLPPVHSLTSVDLSGCKIITSPQDSEPRDLLNADLLFLKQLTNLKGLDLSGCSQVNNGVLVYLQNARSLEFLNISGTQIRGEALENFQRNHPTVKIINNPTESKDTEVQTTTAALEQLSVDQNPSTSLNTTTSTTSNPFGNQDLTQNRS